VVAKVFRNVGTWRISWRKTELHKHCEEISYPLSRLLFDRGSIAFHEQVIEFQVESWSELVRRRIDDRRIRGSMRSEIPRGRDRLTWMSARLKLATPISKIAVSLTRTQRQASGCCQSFLSLEIPREASAIQDECNWWSLDLADGFIDEEREPSGRGVVVGSGRYCEGVGHQEKLIQVKRASSKRFLRSGFPDLYSCWSRANDLERL
jgi:hypothetical protein